MTGSGPESGSRPPGWATRAFNVLMRTWAWNTEGQQSHRWEVDVPVDGTYELVTPISMVGADGFGGTSTQIVHLTHGLNRLTVSPMLRLVESDKDAEARRRREADTPYDPTSAEENDD